MTAGRQGKDGDVGGWWWRGVRTRAMVTSVMLPPEANKEEGPSEVLTRQAGCR